MGGHAIKVDANDNVDIWFRVGTADFDGSRVLAHLVSYGSTGIIEYTHVGVGVGFGCGLHTRSNSSLIYVSVTKAAEDGAGISADCAGNDGVARTFCLDASTLAVKSDTSECEAAGLNNFELTGLDWQTGTPLEVIKAFVVDSANTYDVSELTFAPVDEDSGD